MVLAADAAAHRAGLRVGMPATKARALVFGLIVRDAEPTADAEALDRLALWALQRYSPMVAADPPTSPSRWMRPCTAIIPADRMTRR